MWSALVRTSPDAVEYAKFYSRSHDAVIRVCDEAGERLALQNALDVQGLLAVTGHGCRIIQILSAFNCRFLGPNSR
jgi:hypothetical protein